MVPPIPYFFFILIFVIFLILIFFTDCRYMLLSDVIKNVVVLVSLLITFVIVLTFQKYDRGAQDANFFSQKLLFLATIAKKYDPCSIQLLIEYAQSYLCAQESYVPNDFLVQITPKITDPVEVGVVGAVVNSLITYSDDRVNRITSVPDELWYGILIVLIVGSIFFPMDCRLSRLESFFILVILWLPVLIVYNIYTCSEPKVIAITQKLIRNLKNLYPQSLCGATGPCP